MRILHLAPHCREVGNGVVNVAVDLACKQAEMGHTVGVASGGGSFVDLLIKYGVRHFEAEEEWRRPAAAFAGFSGLLRTLRKFRPDVVHAHAVPGAVLAGSFKWLFGFRLITTVHNAPQRQAVLMGVGDRVIAVSGAVATSMIQRGISPRKVRVVRNGTLGSPRRAREVHSDPLWLDRPAIVTVARLFRQKGIADVIAAFAAISPEFPSAHLFIVGEGPDRPEFEAQVAATACSNRIRFVGFVPDPRRFLAEADIFVLASRQDPFPLVLLEAREAGCAIIASMVDGIPEALEGGRAGLLIPPSSPASLAGALAGLLRDPGKLEDLRLRARKNLGWLHVQRVAEETLEVYREVVGPKFHAVDPAP